MHKLGDRIGPAAAESSWRLFTGLLIWWMERLARAAARGTAPAEIVAGEGAVMQRVVGALGRAGGLDRWVELWDNTRRLFAQADGVNLDRKQVLLQAFIGIERGLQRLTAAAARNRGRDAGAEDILHHHADLLRQRQAAYRPRLHDARLRRAGAVHAARRP